MRNEVLEDRCCRNITETHISYFVVLKYTTHDKRGLDPHAHSHVSTRILSSASHIKSIQPTSDLLWAVETISSSLCFLKKKLHTQLQADHCSQHLGGSNQINRGYVIFLSYTHTWSPGLQGACVIRMHRKRMRHSSQQLCFFRFPAV